MLLCILIHMDAMIILYSTYVFENFRFWQIPKVNPSLKTRFPDEKMIMKISFQTENFAQNWLPDVIFCSKKVSGQFRPAISFKSQFSSGNHFWAKNYAGNQFWAKFYFQKLILMIIFFPETSFSGRGWPRKLTKTDIFKHIRWLWYNHYCHVNKYTK